MSAPTVTRYALTHVNREGMRQLTRANQGRNMFDDEELAKRYREAFLLANTIACLESAYGKQAVGTFEVRPVQCYTSGDAGDAVGIYFDR